ncbi:hypothetical protein GGF46_003129 [Coemansia sp. RSA 552]|nr:hypothetical protein GGF46_003129 [Coemansia sp. RSA 552]
MDNLRLHDYTVLATLGLATLYGGIAARLEDEREQLADDQQLYAPNGAYTGPQTPRSRPGGACSLRSAHASRRKRKNTLASEEAAADFAGATASSSRLQSPRSSAQRVATEASGKRRARSSIRGQGAENGTGARMKSAFARVKHSSNVGAEGEAGSGAGGAESRMRKGKAHVARADATAAIANTAGAADMRPKEHGEVWFDRYLILAKLGEGAFSQAFLAADLHCSRMGRKHDGTRLVTIKRMGAREGAIGISDYETISMLNRLDPKERIPIVRIYGIFLHRPRPQRMVEYDAASRQLMPAQMLRTGFSGHKRGSQGGYTRHERLLAEKARLRVFGGMVGNAGSDIRSDTGVLESSASLGESGPDDQQVCLIMEPLLGKTLHDAFPQRISTLYTAHDEVIARQRHMDMIRTVVRQLLVALAHMHKNSLLHADIKTTNVICVDDTSLLVKLIDFGNAVSDSDVSEYYSTFEIQTVWFRAPEVAYQRPFGKAIDIWSIGCVMCELWLGRPLFTDMDNHNLVRSILKLRGPPPAHLYSASPIYAEVTRSWSGRPTPGFAPAIHDSRHKGFMHSEPSMDWDPQLRMQWLKHSLRVEDDDFVSVVDALLEYDPGERPTASEALKHPFFQGLYRL